MLELVDLMVFESIVAPELGVASSHRVGGLSLIHISLKMTAIV